MTSRIGTLTVCIICLCAPPGFCGFLLDRSVLPPQRCRRRKISHYYSAEGFDDNNESSQNDNDDICVDTVSDAEALLACRAYLQRRNKLDGWTQFERRKNLKASKQQYFWDPSELAYFKDPGSSSISSRKEILEDDLTESTPSSKDREKTEKITFDEKSQDGKVYAKFSTFDSEPSATRLRRSQAALKTWADPEWREKWYEKRWGLRKDRTAANEKRAQKRLEKRVRAIPRGLLGSPELAAMTEEEIEYAIRTYFTSQAKRDKSRSKTRAQQKAALNGPSDNNTRLARDALLKPDSDAMMQARKQRSERAKRAYQTRLQNNPDPQSPIKPPRIVPAGKTPKDAMLRVEASLDQRKAPNAEDIELIMEPAKMIKRKELLLRILRECYNLRGRCVPTTGRNASDEKLVFATQCTQSDLGNFVIRLLRTKQPAFM